MNPKMRPIITTTACLGLLGWIGTACGDDADADASYFAAPATVSDTSYFAAPTSVSDEETGHDDHNDGDDAMTITIDAIDYGFQNVPESVPTGTQLGFSNKSNVELHELVAFRVAGDVPLDELLVQSPTELEATLGPPVTVLLQPPGAADPIMAVGDGTLAEPGRYVLMCFIPIGADPAEYLAAAEAADGGKPEGVAGGPPHFSAGMFAELTVE